MVAVVTVVETVVEEAISAPLQCAIDRRITQ